MHNIIPSRGKSVTVSSSHGLLEIWFQIFNLYIHLFFLERELNKKINMIIHIFFQLSPCYGIIT